MFVVEFEFGEGLWVISDNEVRVLIQGLHCVGSRL